MAIENGLEERMFCHEVDSRMEINRDTGKWSGDNILAHDEVAGRVTPRNRRWTSLNLTSIMELDLVTRRYDVTKGQLASTYRTTREKVPHMEDILREYQNQSHPCFQLDVRGMEIAIALAWYRNRRLHNKFILVKGYNFHYANRRALEEAINAVDGGRHRPFQWSDLEMGPGFMMVFYSEPIIALALKVKGLNDERNPAARLHLDFKTIYDTTMEQVLSYLEVKKHMMGFIPEIVYSGLGLGYNMNTGKARNPLNGDPITDQNLIFQARVDRAMIEVAIQLRRTYKDLYFSSCTRLCDLRVEGRGELVADMKTGELKSMDSLQAKIRSIHGGLFSQSDTVVADDPYAEIAARTWIDEYARLDRSQLLTMSYNEWLAQAGPEVQAAVNALNGPFMQNTWSGTLDEEWNILYP
ncbi:hypothetical protein E8E12_010016 [Didymella heteroderae]|uniref:Uncharacterized protein n=1 Tax=Didymella heteroderae TaxID=1769908 RepID=A0A9P4WUK9_9PLEO|nr:hypothetical protein E8E12_010016 [Didymella heteroderae]